MTRLRDPQTGCPWDREQTLSSLKPCVLEEAYELLSAMDNPGDVSNHIEELGDVLLQVMFQSMILRRFSRIGSRLNRPSTERNPAIARLTECRGRFPGC